MRRYKAILGENGRLSNNQIKKIISRREEETTDLLKLKRYALGDNPGIIDKALDVNQNKIPVSYGRLLVKIVVGFMYKSGLISYGINEGEKGYDAYFDAIQETFQGNREPELNAELGKDQTIFGEAYELHYIDNDEGVDQFAKIPVFEFIPVYNYDIKPKLIAGIRYYKDAESTQQIYKVEVYYADIMQQFELRGGSLTSLGDQVHPYGQVPVVVYRNNEDIQGDLDHIIKLIDAYDILVSTFLDDEEKFAEAILLLYGKYLDTESLDKLQRLRVIDGLKENDKLEYLTKDLSVSGRKELLEIVRQEIHRQSLIPDMTDTAVLGQKSGEAFIYLFALFELLAGEKQSYFAQGLRKRIQLVTSVMNYPRVDKIGDPNVIKINFTRNLPKNLTMLSDVVSKLWGMASERTLLGMLPFIENPDAEIEQKNQEGDPEAGQPRTAEEILSIYQKKLAEDPKTA